MANIKTANIKTAPGIVNLKCMIYEPQPIVSRTEQDQSFAYTGNLLQYMKSFPMNNISGAGDFIHLRDKFLYYDTFLELPQTVSTSGDPTAVPLQFNKDTFLDFKGKPLFDTNNQPTAGWIHHQTFYEVSSFFGNSNVSPTSWTYTKIPTRNQQYDGQSEFDITDSVNMSYSLDRLTWRWQPVQNATSTIQTPANGQTVTNQTKKPVHWMVRKKTPLWSGEGFHVLFHKIADQPDLAVDNTLKMTDTYQYLDTKSNKTAKGIYEQTDIPVNLGLVAFDEQGNVIDQSRDALDLSSQPYYAIELNVGHAWDNYWIIIPWNSSPIFISTGYDYISTPSKVTNDENRQIKVDAPAPGQGRVTRLISTYDIPGEELMNKEYLRVTVKDLNGKYIITFNGYEDRPWVIQGIRLDHAKWKKSSNSGEDALSECQSPFYMMTRPLPISIAAGNLLCGFSFAHLKYETTGFIDVPDTISVAGPVEKEDISLFLRDKQVRRVPQFGLKPVYTQEADVYREVVNGQAMIEQRFKTMLTDIMPYDYAPEFHRLKGCYYKNNALSFTRPPLKSFVKRALDVEDLNLSYISVAYTSQPKVSPDAQNDPNYQKYKEYFHKHFTVKYELGAGDVHLKNSEQSDWIVKNCITPVANGWRLYVPASNEVYSIAGNQTDKQKGKTAQTQKQICPTEVAQHVTSLTVNSSYTDNVRIERSGSIKFAINIGPMTGIDYVNNNTNAGNANSTDCDKYLDNTSDRTAFLSNLSGKTFTLRIYAWWEHGFMECKDRKCPCKVSTQIGTGGDPKVLFTGLCYGGQITVENGKRYMECQLIDYWKYFQDTQFLNSPFFDGMRIFNAIHEIARIAGLDDGGKDKKSGTGSSDRQRDKWPPGLFIKQLADNPKVTGTIEISNVGGEVFRVQPNSLPSSYDVLQSPRYKFSDGSFTDSALVQIAQLDSYVIYFDRYGILRYAPRSDIRACDAIVNGDIGTILKCRFWASPTSSSVDGVSLGTGCRNYDSLALKTYSYQKKVADAYNDIHLITATPNGEIVIGSNISLAGKFDYTQEGYMGYTKRFLQMDGIFGSAEAVQKTAKYYGAFFKPPITFRWGGFGNARLMAGDLVLFAGLQLDNTFPVYKELGYQANALLYLTSVTTELNPEKNEWTNTYEGEWIYVDCGLSGNV